jgi:hypothetical protein
LTYCSGAACPSTNRKLADLLFMCRQRMLPALPSQTAASVFVPPSTETLRLIAGFDVRSMWSQNSRNPSIA